MRHEIELCLSSQLNETLVKELLDAHAETRRNYYLGGLRLAEVEGGRFCEAAFRILEQVSSGSWTPVGATLDTEKLIAKLRNIPVISQPEAVRLHIPRALRLVYDIRNKRDAAHLADGIDPNFQDATLVVSAIDWVLAELIRLFHTVSANEAKVIVDDIVVRRAPLVELFGDALKVLNPKLGATDHCLVLLYERGVLGATFEEIASWVRLTMRPNLRRTLTVMAEQKDLIHYDSVRYRITRLGQANAEGRGILNPEA